MDVLEACQSKKPKHWQLVGSNATSKKISFFDQSLTDESELKWNYCSSYMYTAYYNHNIRRSIRNIEKLQCKCHRVEPGNRLHVEPQAYRPSSPRLCLAAVEKILDCAKFKQGRHGYKATMSLNTNVSMIHH